MTREEILQCLSLLKVNYPHCYKNYTKRDTENLIKLWTLSFGAYPSGIVQKAIVDLIGETQNFAPDIAAIKKHISKYMQAANGEPTTDELWSILDRAVSRSAYDSAEEFERLPGVVQQFAGGASQLKTWANMDERTFSSVIYSQFLKRIESCKERVRFEESLNPGMREVLISMASKMSLPEAEK